MLSDSHDLNISHLKHQHRFFLKWYTALYIEIYSHYSQKKLIQKVQYLANMTTALQNMRTFCFLSQKVLSEDELIYSFIKIYNPPSFIDVFTYETYFKQIRL